MTGEIWLRASIAVLGAVAFALVWIALIMPPVTAHWLTVAAIALALIASIGSAILKRRHDREQS